MTSIKTALIAAVAIAASATPALAKDTDALVAKVRTAAAWRGVEVNRIQRTDQTLRVLGTDRSGRDVALTMSCDKLGYVCAPTGTGQGFEAMAR